MVQRMTVWTFRGEMIRISRLTKATVMSTMMLGASFYFAAHCFLKNYTHIIFYSSITFFSSLFYLFHILKM